MVDVASVVERTVRKYICKHLAPLFLISKMINLAKDVSNDQCVLTTKIFGATTTRHFLTVLMEWHGAYTPCTGCQFTNILRTFCAAPDKVFQGRFD
jgi:hypothetical protein